MICEENEKKVKKNVKKSYKVENLPHMHLVINQLDSYGS